MSTRFPDINSKEIVKVVEKLGFRFVEQSTISHVVYFREADKRRITENSSEDEKHIFQNHSININPF